MLTRGAEQIEAQYFGYDNLYQHAKEATRLGN